jgi:hypothetical protein
MVVTLVPRPHSFGERCVNHRGVLRRSKLVCAILELVFAIPGAEIVELAVILKL